MPFSWRLAVTEFLGISAFVRSWEFRGDLRAFSSSAAVGFRAIAFGLLSFQRESFCLNSFQPADKIDHVSISYRIRAVSGHVRIATGSAIRRHKGWELSKEWQS